jgi:hypothetical protein
MVNHWVKQGISLVEIGRGGTETHAVSRRHQEEVRIMHALSPVVPSFISVFIMSSMASEGGSVKQIVKQWEFSVLVLLVLVGAANLTAYYVDLPFNVVAVGFINRNLVNLLVISALFMLGRVYADTAYPVNLSAPVFTAVAALLLAAFLFRFLRLIEIMVGMELFFRNASPYQIYTLVFLTVLFAGVILTLRRREA